MNIPINVLSHQDKARSISRPVEMEDSEPKMSYSFVVRVAQDDTHSAVWTPFPERSSRARRSTKIEKYAPHFYGHYFRIESEEDLDAQLFNWIREAYADGQQKQLGK